MNPTTNKKIAIVGGGPGGLTLARLLQQKGATVTVYERDVNQHVRVQGATLDLHHDSGLLALQEAGLIDAFKAAHRPGADRTRIVEKTGTVIFDDNFNDSNDLFRPEIDRGPLRKLLLDSLQPDTVVWDSQFVSLTPYGNGWLLDFKNGSSAFADLVIAADGANSKIRPLITPIKPFYSGVTIVEGSVYNTETTVSSIHTLLNGGKIFALDNEKTLIVSSKGDGSLVFYTGCKTDEFWFRDNGIDFSDRAQVINWFKETFSDWDACWLELIENARLPLTLRPQYCMPVDQTWEALPNLTLLGDAAHLMPPYAGEGVNMAMLDALELSKCLTNEAYTNTQTAIAAYENQMRTRASEIARLTLAQTDSLHSSDAISNLLELFNQTE
ncbi:MULTISPECIES: NAD(P)/FAD-dependent oxidoreductase [unclassified Spirosoma]|uniref:FAD-dependent oxidoreductase n=1 Tax=unclassified Spirosoma TaxID=2621999 RepID=UPI000965B47B|nr:MULTISPECIES: NAD(P)/FAD-dependent oxidoreductase [unclassified Spirosoma]MBN8826445.1 FAD-dependent monooxygenase [Spirosoma sp.]OJW75834.1 MAG: 2-polyprenyl-6-methoxyphenol hydroxylase [Spirosoma sp. 48-14]